MGLIYSVIKDITTEKDGLSYDIAKILWVVGTLVFFGLVVYTTILIPASFNMMNFGIAFAGILAGGGASIKIKESNEQPFAHHVGEITEKT